MKLNTLFGFMFIFMAISVFVFMSETLTYQAKPKLSIIDKVVQQSEYNYNFDDTFYELSLFNGNFSGIEQIISYVFAMLSISALGDIISKFLKNNKKEKLQSNKGV